MASVTSTTINDDLTNNGFYEFTEGTEITDTGTIVIPANALLRATSKDFNVTYTAPCTSFTRSNPAVKFGGARARLENVKFTSNGHGTGVCFFLDKNQGCIKDVEFVDWDIGCLIHRSNSTRFRNVSCTTCDVGIQVFDNVNEVEQFSGTPADDGIFNNYSDFGNRDNANYMTNCYFVGGTFTNCDIGVRVCKQKPETFDVLGTTYYLYQESWCFGSDPDDAPAKMGGTIYGFPAQMWGNSFYGLHFTSWNVAAVSIEGRCQGTLFKACQFDNVLGKAVSVIFQNWTEPYLAVGDTNFKTYADTEDGPRYPNNTKVVPNLRSILLLNPTWAINARRGNDFIDCVFNDRVGTSRSLRFIINSQTLVDGCSFDSLTKRTVFPITATNWDQFIRVRNCRFLSKGIVAETFDDVFDGRYSPYLALGKNALIDKTIAKLWGITSN